MTRGVFLYKDALNNMKLRLARAVLDATDMSTLRAKSLSALERWRQSGAWCTAYDEWRELMTNGSDAEIVTVMTSESEKATRLRQSPPYVGILDRETVLRIKSETSTEK